MAQALLHNIFKQISLFVVMCIFVEVRIVHSGPEEATRAYGAKITDSCNPLGVASRY